MMTNREKHLDEILAVQHWGNFNGEIRGCGNCPECDFNDGSNIFHCKKARLAWLRAEADEEPKVDWSKVPVDTPVYVRDREDQDWKPRYFAKYEGGLVYAWDGGTTSWSTNGSTMYWNCARLAKEDDNGNNRGNEA